MGSVCLISRVSGGMVPFQHQPLASSQPLQVVPHPETSFVRMFQKETPSEKCPSELVASCLGGDARTRAYTNSSRESAGPKACSPCCLVHIHCRPASPRCSASQPLRHTPFITDSLSSWACASKVPSSHPMWHIYRFVSANVVVALCLMGLVQLRTYDVVGGIRYAVYLSTCLPSPREARDTPRRRNETCVPHPIGCPHPSPCHSFQHIRSRGRRTLSFSTRDSLSQEPRPLFGLARAVGLKVRARA